MASHFTNPSPNAVHDPPERLVFLFQNAKLAVHMTEKEKFRGDEGVQDYKDAVLGDSLEGRLRAWEKRLKLADTFALFYVFCPEEKFAQVLGQIQNKLKIPTDNVIHIDQGSTSLSSYTQLRDHEVELAASTGNEVLVVVHGFDEVIAHAQATAPASLWRVGHDNDQAYKEFKRSPDHLQLPNDKKIAVITHIRTEDPELFRGAYEVVSRSQFKDDFFVIDPPTKAETHKV